MALSITSVTPNSGVTSGWDRVTIEGTDFDVHPYPPVATGYVGKPDPWPSVKVFFGDMEADPRLIKVYDDQTIECSVPRYLGDPGALPALVDVKVENQINPGSVTSVDAFTYAKPSSVTASVLNLVVKGAILQLSRQIAVNRIMQRTHTRYDNDVSDGLNIVQVADVPAMLINGPTISRSPGAYRRQHVILVDDSGPEDVYRQPTVVDLLFEVQLIDKHMGRLLNLVDAFTRFLDENGKLIVEQVPNDPTQGTVEFDMEWDTLPDVRTPADINNLVTAEGSFIVFGVPIDRVTRIKIDRAEEIDDIVLDMRYIDLF